MVEKISARLSDRTSDGKMKLFLNLSKAQVEKYSLEKHKYVSLSSLDKNKLVVKFHERPIPTITRKWKVSITKVNNVVRGASVPLDPSDFNLGSTPILGMELPVVNEDGHLVVNTENTPLSNAPLPELNARDVPDAPVVKKWGTDLEGEVNAEVERRIRTYFKLKYTLDL